MPCNVLKLKVDMGKINFRFLPNQKIAHPNKT